MMRCLPFVVVSCLALVSAPIVEAAKPRLRLHQLDARRCAAEGVVRAFVTKVELEGRVLLVDPSSYHLVLDGAATALSPTHATAFAATKVPLEVAIVAQNSLAYHADMARIRRGLELFVGKLPKRSSVSVVFFGWQVDVALRQGTPQRASQVLTSFTAKSDAGTLALLPALEAGLKLLTLPPEANRKGASKSLPPEAAAGLSSTAAPPKAFARRLLVVLSNGLNRDLARDLFRGFGDKARRAGVPIHPVAYSPTDERQPLLNLGELAKRSLGTLRWARRPTDLRDQLRNLATEVNEQQVLSFTLDDACRSRHQLQVSHGVLRSNALSLEAQRSASRGAQFLFIVAVLGGGVLLSALGFWLLRGRQDR